MNINQKCQLPHCVKKVKLYKKKTVENAGRHRYRPWRADSLRHTPALTPQAPLT